MNDSCAWGARKNAPASTASAVEHGDKSEPKIAAAAGVAAASACGRYTSRSALKHAAANSDENAVAAATLKRLAGCASDKSPEQRAGGAAAELRIALKPAAMSPPHTRRKSIRVPKTPAVHTSATGLQQLLQVTHAIAKRGGSKRRQAANDDMAQSQPGNNSAKARAATRARLMHHVRATASVATAAAAPALTYGRAPTTMEHA